MFSDPPAGDGTRWVLARQAQRWPHPQHGATHAWRPHSAGRAGLSGVEDRGLVHQAEGGSTSLLDAARNLFLRPADGEAQVVHRLAVFEAHGEITSIVSQTDVMRFLLSKLDELGPMADRSLEELGLLTGGRRRARPRTARWLARGWRAASPGTTVPCTCTAPWPPPPLPPTPHSCCRQAARAVCQPSRARPAGVRAAGCAAGGLASRAGGQPGARRWSACVTLAGAVTGVDAASLPPAARCLARRS